MRFLRNIIARINRRRRSIEIGGNLGPSGSLIADKKSSDGSQAIRVAATSVSATVDKPDARTPIAYSISGRGPQGERFSLLVGGVLIDRLNELGGEWSVPIKPEGLEQGIDCVSISASGQLAIQVTRAIGDKTMWQELARSGSVTRSADEARLADDMHQAISHKLSIPPLDRRQIVLALDAYLSSGTTLPSVVSTFKSKYGGWISSLGFKSVWVVGPTTAQTARLDSD